MSHESFKLREEIQISSEKSFGQVFAVVFAIIGFWPLLVNMQAPSWWAVAVSAALLIISLVYPLVLKPFNVAWYWLGRALFHITTPIVLFALYCVTIVPIGLIMRLSRKDLLKMKLSDTAPSYWQERTEEISPESLKNQF